MNTRGAVLSMWGVGVAYGMMIHGVLGTDRVGWIPPHSPLICTAQHSTALFCQTLHCSALNHIVVTLNNTAMYGIMVQQPALQGTLLCTPPSRAKRCWAGWILFSPIFSFVPGYYRVSCLRTMYAAHISSNGSHFLTAGVLVYWTYKVNQFGYGRTKWMVTMYSKNTAHISLNGSNFLTAWILVYWTYKVSSWYISLNI